MINANELRIGNIIRHVNDNGTFDLPDIAFTKMGS